VAQTLPLTNPCSEPARVMSSRPRLQSPLLAAYSCLVDCSPSSSTRGGFEYELSLGCVKLLIFSATYLTFSICLVDCHDINYAPPHSAGSTTPFFSHYASFPLQPTTTSSFLPPTPLRCVFPVFPDFPITQPIVPSPLIAFTSTTP